MDKSLIKTIAELFKIERKETDDRIYSTVIEYFDKCKPGLTGEKGETGSPGEPGKDKIIITPRRVTDDSIVEKNDLVYSQGGLFQAIRKSDGGPVVDPGSFQCLISGVSEVEFIEEWQTRTLDVYARLTDGDIQKTSFPMGPRFLKSTAGVKVIEGDWLFNGEHLLIAKCDEPTLDDWTDINLAIQGEKGARGRRGLPGDTGAPGEPGRDGIGIIDIIAEKNSLIVELSSGETKEIPLSGYAAEDIDQPIKSYQGYYDQNEPYKAGDVVTAASGLFVALVDATGDLLNPEIWAKMLGTQNPGGLLEWPMIWKNKWQQKLYHANDVVLDNGWLMVANKNTEERAGPYAIGTPEYVYQGAGLTTTDETAKQIIFGSRYEFDQGGYFTGARVWTYAGNYYSLYVIRNPGPSQVIDLFAEWTATTDGWREFNTNQEIVLAGTRIDIVAVASVPDPVPVEQTFNYDYNTPNNEAIPAAGAIVHANQLQSVMRIDKNDDDGTDRSAFLEGLTVGDGISGAGVSWLIQSVTDSGTYMEYGIAPGVQGSPDGTQGFTFQTVTAAAVDYGVDVDYNLLNPSVKGLYIADGEYSDIAVNDNQYGIDIELQNASVSEDWDFMAVTNGSGSVTGDAGITEYINFQYDSLPGTVTDVDETYPVDVDTVGPNQVQVRVQAELKAGTYKVTFSSTAEIDAINNSVYTRFSLDGGATWEEGSKEAKDSSDRLFGYYGFPIALPAGSVDYVLQVRKESAANTLNVEYANITIERVA